MPEFNLGSLDGWEAVEVGELIGFTVPALVARAVRFDVMADQHVSVQIVTGEDRYIVAAGVGRLGVRFTIDTDFAVVVDGPETRASCSAPDANCRSSPSRPRSRTRPSTPRKTGPSEELRRMMHMVKINADRRERAMMDEIRRLGRVHPSQVAAAATTSQQAGDPPADLVEGEN